MISQLNPKSQLFLNGLNRIHDRLSTAQRQITSGLRVATVSDDPDQIGTLLAARQHLETAQQIKLNIGRIQGEVDGAEAALQNATVLLDRVHTLGAQGASDFQTADSRAALAGEVGSLLEQLVGLAGTSIEGRHVFAGDKDQTTPYTIDLTQTTPISTYQGAAASRRVQHPNGTTFAVAQTAQEIFDNTDPTKSVFKTVEALRQALLANDTTAIQTAIGNLTPATTQLSSSLSFYGTTQNKIAEALDFGEQLQTQLKSQISTLQDADVTEAIVELQQGQTQQQAALSSWAQIPRSTLFDFLG
jgi:flagellar hook-associated protein 3 FlgL